MALPSRLRAMSWLSCPIDCRGQRKLERRRYRGRDRVRTWGTTLILLPSSSSSESAVLRKCQCYQAQTTRLKLVHILPISGGRCKSSLPLRDKDDR